MKVQFVVTTPDAIDNAEAVSLLNHLSSIIHILTIYACGIPSFLDDFPYLTKYGCVSLLCNVGTT